MAVVAPGELEDLLPAGRGPCQAQGAHRRFGAAGDEADHLDRRQRLDHDRGQLHLTLGGSPERGAAGRRSRDGRHHPGVSVAEDEGAPRSQQVDVGAAVDVGDPRPSPRGDEPRLSAYRAERPDRRGDAAGHESPGAGEHLPGTPGRARGRQAGGRVGHRVGRIRHYDESQRAASRAW